MQKWRYSDLSNLKKIDLEGAWTTVKFAFNENAYNEIRV